VYKTFNPPKIAVNQGWAIRPLLSSGG